MAFPAFWNKDVNQSHCDKGFRRHTAGVLLQRIWFGEEPGVLKVLVPLGWCTFFLGGGFSVKKKKIDISVSGRILEISKCPNMSISNTDQNIV